MTIIIVEDNAVDTELITEAFDEVLDCTPGIITMSDGEVALATLRGMKEKPSLMILDLNLPKKGGLEILKEIRGDPDPDVNLIPVIILTNSKTSRDVRSAYQHRCNAFVRKPLGYPKLLDAIKKLSGFWCQCAILPNQQSEPPPSA